MMLDNFWTELEGETPQKAFEKGIQAYDEFVEDEDLYEELTEGTIAMKFKMVMVDVPDGWKPQDLAESILFQKDNLPERLKGIAQKIDDSDGPAGCIELRKGHYLFFGWAKC